MVEQHNAKNLSWTMGLNQFADLTTQEFNDRLGLRPALHEPAGNKHVASGVGAATSMDWRTKNAVTPVKNQGSCGSCWAFSTVVSLEGQVAIKTGKVVSFSEQDFVDCVKDVKLNSSSQTCCDGCQGGLMDYAFKYMLDSQSGLDDTEAAYPYAGANQKCSFSSSSTGGVPIKGFTDVTDENTLLDAVTNVGPVSVGVDAGIGWQLYFGGVMDPLPIVGCSADKSKMDHGVAVVGYGTANKDYWIIKNSWGAGWGEKGYLRLVRNKNACGVANGAVYPTL
eukprot:TRINITY_DN18048_c0_g2_i3.p2 TRINITY_DN18048_c0_g2~~TRINITY_DN18048_c0_g2_i3.p2  ORF type:complete len:280 (-),score=77.85 TRINITY_DN18048_c0_g2_i3:436-1275(-)